MSWKNPLCRALLIPFVTFSVLLMGCATMADLERALELVAEFNALFDMKAFQDETFNPNGSQRIIRQEIFSNSRITFKEQVTSSRQVRSASTGAVSTIDLAKLAEDGYIAVRVPHVPPAFVESEILSPTVKLSFTTPESPDEQTLDVAVVRRDEHLAAVNAAFPIADNRSHWEVWWLPLGESLPIPASEFTLERTFLTISYVISYGDGQDGRNCGDCPIEFRLFNGFVFLGPYFAPLTKNPKGNAIPAAIFDKCGGTMAEIVAPDGVLTIEHCLSNLDSVTRTFTIAHSSSLGLDYDFFVRSNLVLPGETFRPLANNRVDVPPSQSGFIGIIVRAIHTPTVSFPADARETYHLTATSVLSPEVTASAISFGFGTEYELDEEPDQEPDPEGDSLFLPAARKAEEPEFSR
jgi:hypothetical protein